jgi:RNA polymerase sigma factor (sigma-70 family)
VDQDSKYLGDFDLCHECLEGKTSAIAALQVRFGPPTKSYLIGAGAKPHEADDVVCQLWSDLIRKRDDRPPRLQMYNGTCALQTWLNTVALNRLLSRKRNQQRWRELMPVTTSGGGGEMGDESFEDCMAAPDADEAGDSPLMEIMKIAVETAFQSCEPEDFVLLHLKHFDGLRGAELGRMFGCHESMISRRIDRAEQVIADTTLRAVRQTDPWLELKWSDFLDLCRSAGPGCFGRD